MRLAEKGGEGEKERELTRLPIRRSGVTRAKRLRRSASRRPATNSQLPGPRGIATSSPDADTKDGTSRTPPRGTTPARSPKRRLTFLPARPNALN